jgi:hypothetical protein
MIMGLSPLCQPEGRKEEHFKRRVCPSAGPLDFRPLGREFNHLSGSLDGVALGRGWASDLGRVIGL